MIRIRLRPEETVLFTFRPFAAFQPEVTTLNGPADTSGDPRFVLDCRVNENCFNHFGFIL